MKKYTQIILLASLIIVLPVSKIFSLVINYVPKQNTCASGYAFNKYLKYQVTDMLDDKSLNMNYACDSITLNLQDAIYTYLDVRYANPDTSFTEDLLGVERTVGGTRAKSIHEPGTVILFMFGFICVAWMLFVKNIIKVIAGFMEYLSFNVTFIFLVAIFIPVCAGAKGPDVVRETKYAKDPVNIEMTIKPLSGKEAAIIYFGDGTEASENINITKTGAIILQHVYKNPGDYTVVVRVHRAVGNVKQDQWYRKCLKVSNQNSLPEPSTTVLFSLAIAGLILQVSKKFYIRLRRLLDIIISIIALAVASPIMIVVAIIIKIDSPGPILYKQIRVGLNRRQGKSVSLESLDRRDSNCLGKLFYIYKFRTMRVDAESETGAVWAAPGDNRITRLGRFLRKSRLDELPQFYNVIRGEMSFIGPRPERPEFVKDLNNYICLYNKRLDIKPGITGLAQVRFSYSSSVKDTKKKVKYDLLYLKNNCFLMDLRILLSTFLTVILAKGAR